MPTERDRHLALARREDFPFACDPRLFSDEEYALVRRWGYWYQGLTDGELKPLTAAQRAFVAAVGAATPPTAPHAAAWWRYRKRRAIEQKYGASMHQVPEANDDTFYSRAMVKQQRRPMWG